MRSSKLDFSAPSNIINPSAELGKTFQQTSANLGQIIAQDEARKQQEIANARQAALDAQNKQLFDLKMGEADRIAKEREANIEFGSKLPEMMDQKTWASVGDFYNRPEVATELIGKIAIPQKFMNAEGQYDASLIKTPEDKKLYEDAMAAQQAFSDKYNQMGQQQYLSESIGQEISARRAAGLPVTQDILTAYTDAIKEEKTAAQKASEAASKLADEKGAAVDKLTLERAKLDVRALGKGGTGFGSGGGYSKSGTKVDDYTTLETKYRDMVSPAYSPFKLDAKTVSNVVNDAKAIGVPANVIENALQRGIELGVYGNTIKTEKEMAQLIAEESNKQTPGRGAGSTWDPRGLDVIQSRLQSEAAQARQKAADALLSPEERRAAKAEQEGLAYLASLKNINKADTVVAPTYNSVKNGTKKEEVKKVVEKLGGGLNKDGTLNADAVKAINDSLKKQGIKEEIQKGTTAEKANEIVERLTQESKSTPVKEKDYTGKPYDFVREKSVPAAKSLWEQYKTRVAKPIQQFMESSLGMDYATIMDSQGKKQSVYIGNIPIEDREAYLQSLSK